jgi:hypothetical protein
VKDATQWTRVGPLGQTPRRITDSLPLYLIFDSETMPQWFGMPDDKDLPSTFCVEYVRAWKKPEKPAASGPDSQR